MSVTRKNYPFPEFEARWQKHWLESGAFCAANPGDPSFRADAKKYYVLDMFPYPSGDGLHVGHVEGQLALRLQQPRQVVHAGERARVPCAELSLHPLERAAVERLGLGQLALRLKQHRQVVHGAERVRVVRAELPLAPLERAAEERLGLGQLALRQEQRGQVGHGGERVRVVRAELPLAPVERAAEERLGLG